MGLPQLAEGHEWETSDHFQNALSLFEFLGVKALFNRACRRSNHFVCRSFAFGARNSSEMAN